MGTPELQLDVIRQRLIDLQSPATGQNGAVELPWDNAPSPNVGFDPPAGSTVLASTVEALRQRSTAVSPDYNATGAAPMQTPPPSPQATPSQRPPELDMHLHRLYGQAQQINALAQEQEALIQAFKRSVDSLAWHLRRQGSPWSLEQFCRLESIAIAQVLEDAQGAMVLTATAVDLYEDEQNAAQAAHLLRNQARSAANPQAQLGGEAETWSRVLIREQIAALTHLWQGLTTTLEHHSRLSALAILGWLLGGVISRKVIELTLAVLPSLWPLLIGGIVGLVGWALYRLISNPRSDLAVIARILLALLGLVLGGQL